MSDIKSNKTAPHSRSKKGDRSQAQSEGKRQLHGNNTHRGVKRSHEKIKIPIGRKKEHSRNNSRVNVIRSNETKSSKSWYSKRSKYSHGTKKFSVKPNRTCNNSAMQNTKQI